MKPRFRGEQWLLVLFLMPALFFFFFAQGYPLFYSFYISLKKWSFTSSAINMKFIGLSNYLNVIKDPVFQHSVVVSFIFFLVATFFEVILGFFIATLVVGESNLLKVSRTILILPMVIAPVAVGTTWRMLFNSKAGLINYALKLVGIKGPNWLATPFTALLSAIIVDVWEWTPFALIIFVAAIGSLPLDILNAAQIDGASRWQELRYIILPLLTPVIILVILLRSIETFFVFDIIYTLTYGGPGFSTNVVTLYIYNQGLKYFNVGYSAAASLLLLFVCALVVIKPLMNYSRR